MRNYFACLTRILYLTFANRAKSAETLTLCDLYYIHCVAFWQGPCVFIPGQYTNLDYAILLLRIDQPGLTKFIYV